MTFGAAKQPSSQAAKQPSSQAAKQPSSQAAKQPALPVVLYADDMALLHHSVKVILSGKAILLPQVLTLEALERRIDDDCDFDLLLLELIFHGDEVVVGRIPAYLRRRPGIRIIAFSGDDTAQRVRQTLMAGAAGFVSKFAAMRDLLPAIEVVLAGERFVSEDLVPLGVPALAGVEKLSSEARRVLRELHRGRRYPEIVAELNIAEKTVEYHVGRIKQALGLPRGRTKWQALW